MVQHLHDAENWDVGMLDPEGVEDLMVQLMGLLERLYEAGSLGTRAALFVPRTRRFVDARRHLSPPFGSMRPAFRQPNPGG
jgi:hypothetical protein